MSDEMARIAFGHGFDDDDPVVKSIDTYVRNLRDGHEAYAEERLHGIGWVKPVRCNECRHYRDDFANGYGYCMELSDDETWVPMDSDDFCSHGERSGS